MTQLSTALNLSHRAEEALTFYRELLGFDPGPATTDPDPTTAEVDPRPGRGISHVTVTLVLDTVSEATRMYEALADDGSDSTPIEATPWGHWGCTTDRFGVRWMFNVPDQS